VLGSRSYPFFPAACYLIYFPTNSPLFFFVGALLSKPGWRFLPCRMDTLGMSILSNTGGSLLCTLSSPSSTRQVNWALRVTAYPPMPGWTIVVFHAPKTLFVSQSAKSHPQEKNRKGPSLLELGRIIHMTLLTLKSCLRCPRNSCFPMSMRALSVATVFFLCE